MSCGFAVRIATGYTGGTTELEFGFRKGQEFSFPYIV
jgi:hypothetical protein